MNRPKSAEDYIISQENWENLLRQLREIILSTELMETIKWGIPTYTLKGKNVVSLASFQDYAGLWFFNGVFLQDELQVLVNAQDGTTKAQRQWRFTKNDRIDAEMIKLYLEEAIQNQKAGMELKPKKKALVQSELLNQELQKHPKLQQCFKMFTPGLQQEFIRFIEEAKKEETKISRIEKIKPLILNQIGLNDKYRSN